MRSTLIFLLCIFASVSAHAQAHKCKAPNGRTIYSDAPCAAEQSGGAIRLNENVLETRGDWERNERYIQEREEQKLIEQQSAARQAAAAERQFGTAPIRSLGQRDTPTASKDQRSTLMQTQSGKRYKVGSQDDPHVAVKLSPEERAAADLVRAQRAEAARAQAHAEALAPAKYPRDMKHCDMAGCEDFKGNKYKPVTNGNFTRQDGKYCYRFGDNLSCG